ncbi:MAG: histidinol-phosphate transaminase [Victivallales bacterium]|nr:histidinol-phosphate transaminase [Victivallales bacterium]
MNTEINKSYFRPEIDAIAGYAPGEQPRMPDLLKLNTNENPYPPSPKVLAGLRQVDGERLRLYPDPNADRFCAAVAGLCGCQRENVIAANGSDDILTIAFRAFTDARRPAAFLEPTYSLYPVLADLQGCRYLKLPLKADFSPPDDLPEQAAPANLLIIARPNAPTGNSISLDYMRRICTEFDGVVLIDEAYADFADDNCMDFPREFPNVIVSRSFSKSYSLAGLRLGFAVAPPDLIAGMMKIKDSYNVSMLTQYLGELALGDQAYLRQTVAAVKASRTKLTAELRELGFEVVDSQSNFVFAAPPDGNAEKLFNALREQNIIVRYFPGRLTGRYLRISIGSDAQLRRLTDFLRSIY